MASSKRQHASALRDLLVREGATFDFRQAVDILERTNVLQPARVGELGPVARESVHFTHDPSFAFPTGDIASISEQPNSSALTLSATFLGLLGSSSPLPTYFSEEVVLADADEAKRLRVVYDFLHHRLYSLFYRAITKYRFSASGRADGRDPFTQRAMSFVGVDPQAISDRGLSAAHLLGLAPLLSLGTRSARAMRVLLESTLPNVPVDVECFVHRMVILDDSERNSLGRRNMALGTSFTIGGRVEDRSGRFRTRLGPVSYETMETLMPGGEHHAVLRQIVDQFTGGVLEAEVEVILNEDTSPRFCLGKERGGRLGVSTTLGRRGKGGGRVRFTLGEDSSRIRTEFIPE